MVSVFSLSDKLVSFCSNLSSRWLQKTVASLIYLLYTRGVQLNAVMSQFWLPQYIVTGIEKESGKRICFLYIGNEKFPLFLSDLLFVESPKVDRIGTVFVWRLQRIVDGLSRDIDAVLVSCDTFYRRWLSKAGLIVFPHMVDMALDISQSFDEFYKGLSNSAKSDVRKVNREGYSYEILSDIDSLRSFYNKMYLPLIQSRFADKPMYTPPFLFFRLLQMTGYRLLIVKDTNGNAVSGCFFSVKDDEVFSRYNGVFEGDVGLITVGAESALYYFLIDWAKKNGFNKVDLGYCRPFLHDGVFRYKQKWGALMRLNGGTLRTDLFGLRIAKKDSVLHDFFQRNPFYKLNQNNEYSIYPLDGE